ncbi:MAG: CAP domain-containing protein [Propionibacteriaceae bacterium]|nr:CAP domain-containing protein [Propionibacteriaceae bacterium]
MRSQLSMWKRATTAVAVLAIAGMGLVAPQASAAPYSGGLDPQDKASVRQAYQTYYAPALSVAPGWTGSVANCDAGTTSAASNDAILTVINFYRALAGLGPVTQDATTSTTYDQQAALMLQAAGTLSHARPSTWTCYTPEGGNTFPPGVVSEAIAYWQGTYVNPISIYVDDSGMGNEILGHRAQILYANTGSLSFASTSNFNVLHVLADYSVATPGTYAWPSAGYFPYEVMNTTAQRWSYYPAACDASTATVAVTKNGTALATSNASPVWNAADSYHLTALGWDMPPLTAPALGAEDTYVVTISGLTGCSTTSDSYTVTAFNAAETTVTIAGVTISGTAQVGQALTATATGVLPADASLAYAWHRGTQVVGTGSAYTPTAADNGQALTVTVTGTKTGAVPGSATSAAVTVQPGTLTAPQPVIIGAAQTGQTLSVTTGAWAPTGVALAYQWSADGVPVTGATAATYPLTSGDIGKTFTVAVTGTLAGYTPTTATSASTVAVVKPAIVAGTPTISGTAQVGQTLAADIGTWSPDGLTVFREWWVNEIGSGSSSTYTILPEDLGAMIRFETTAWYDGLPVKQSVTVGPVVAGTLTTAQPTISGVPAVGGALTANPGVWSPAGVEFAYQWSADGVEIPGATAATYALTSGDIGKTFTVAVTGSLTGYTSATLESAATAAVASTPASAETPAGTPAGGTPVGSETSGTTTVPSGSAAAGSTPVTVPGGGSVAGTASGTAAAVVLVLLGLATTLVAARRRLG